MHMSTLKYKSSVIELDNEMQSDDVSTLKYQSSDNAYEHIEV